MILQMKIFLRRLLATVSFSLVLSGCAGMTVQEAFFGANPLPWDEPGRELVELPPAKTVGLVVVGVRMKSPLSNSYILHRFDRRTLLTHELFGFGIGNKMSVLDAGLGPPPIWPENENLYGSIQHYDYQGLVDQLSSSFEHVFIAKGIRPELLNYKSYMAGYSQESTLEDIVGRIKEHEHVDLVGFVFFEAIRAWSIEESQWGSPTKTFKNYSGAWLLGRCVVFRTSDSEKVLDMSFSRDNFSVPEVSWRMRGLGSLFNSIEGDFISGIRVSQGAPQDIGLRYVRSQEAYVEDDNGKPVFHLNIAQPVEADLRLNQADKVQVKISGWMPAAMLDKSSGPDHKSVVGNDQPVYLWPHRKAGLQYQAKENAPVNISPLGQGLYYEAIGEVLPGAVLQETGRNWPLWSRSVRFDGKTADLGWEAANSLWKHVELQGSIRVEKLADRITEVRIPGVISGRITRGEQPAPDIEVEVANIRTRTNANGEYKFNHLPPGVDYPLRVRPFRRGEWYEVALDTPVIPPAEELTYPEIDLDTFVLQGEDVTKAKDAGISMLDGESIQIPARYGKYILPAIYLHDNAGRSHRVYPTRILPEDLKEQGRSVTGTFVFYVPKGSTVEKTVGDKLTAVNPRSISVGHDG